MTVKRFTPRKTPYAEMIALPDGEYVRHEDYAALELHNEYLLARLRKQGEQLDAIGAGGVSGQPITSQRRGEPVACFKCGHAKHGGECVNVVPQPAEPDYKQLYEQMCERCDALDAKLAEYSELEPVDLDRYDAGYLGGQDGMPAYVWHDIIRAELDRAYDFYADQLDRATPQPSAPAQEPRVPEGWQLVPKEPTEEMLEGTESYLINPDGEPVDVIRTTKEQYRELLEAAPKFGEEK